MKRLASILLVLSLASCTKKPADGAGSGSGSDMPAMGSAVGASGSAAGSATGSAAGSAAGSAMAGSGSDAGSAAAGSGSATGSDAGSGSAAGSGSGSGSATAEAKSEFDKLSFEAKKDFMKKTVVPAMKTEFQKFDAKKYANFGCKTCHGKDPAGAKYEMPSADLPKLDFAALQAGKQEPKTAEWMGKVVKPGMAKLLGEKEFDMAHPEAGGFGCLECHQQKK